MLDQDLFAEARRLDRADLANQQHDVVRRRLRQSQLGMLTANYAILVIEPECLRDEKDGIVGRQHRSEEHTSELQSLMRISYAVFCLKKKTHNTNKKRQIVKTIKSKKYNTA